MTKLFILLMFLMAFALSACHRELPEEKVITEPQPPEIYVQAQKAEKQGDYQKAFMLYSELVDKVDTPKIIHDLTLRRSETLMKMGQYPAAFSMLNPMPEYPTNLYECQKMILAAQILKKMNGKPEHVEALMEVAIDNRIDENGAILFKAQGYAMLGREYVANGKTARAMKCFEYAAELYEKDGKSQEANTCRNIADYLR